MRPGGVAPRILPLRKLGDAGMALRFCYQAGPCGYGIQRRVSAQGHECVVVAARRQGRDGRNSASGLRDKRSLSRHLGVAVHAINRWATAWPNLEFASHATKLADKL